MKSVTVINRLLIKPGKMDEFIEAQRKFAAALADANLQPEIATAELRLEAGAPVPGLVVRATKPAVQD